jgi:AsmA protein
LDLKDLAGNVQEQVQQKAKETVKELLEGAKSPRDLKQEGKDLLKGLFGR